MLRPEWMFDSREIKVGAFVLAGLCLIGLVIFLIGDERQMFSKKIPYEIVFDDVQGLKRGSTVRMGGIDVGSVSHVGYSADHRDARLYVSLQIVETEARRIREDSRARIQDKGLLGDKMITLLPGNPELPPLPSGGRIPAEKDPKDLGAALHKVGELATKAENVLANLEITTTMLADEELVNDLKSSARSLSRILSAADSGPGYVAKLLSDPNEATRLSQTVANLEQASAGIGTTLGRVDRIAERVEQGPGLVHSIVFDEAGANSVAQIGAAAEELREMLAAIESGQGLAHSLVYGDEQTANLIRDLNQIVADAQAIVAGVRSGKGTLGALLVDPSVYEDLKVILGNVERNRALRALVRYSVKQSDGARVVEVKDPATSPTEASTPTPPIDQKAQP